MSVNTHSVCSSSFSLQRARTPCGFRMLRKLKPELQTQSAFTLIEVMIALVAFGIILAAINGVFFGALKLRNKTVEAVDAALPLEQAISILKSDLGAIVPPGGLFAGQFSSSATSSTNILMSGNTQVGSSSPEFFTCGGSVDDRTLFGDLQKVSYSLVASDASASGRDLVRYVQRNLLAIDGVDFEERTILKGVDRFYFSYFDGSVWKETWTTNETLVLPRAVKVEIAMAGDKRAANGAKGTGVELVVPLVDAGTNSTAQVTQ
jgi:type II secretion system protein J